MNKPERQLRKVKISNDFDSVEVAFVLINPNEQVPTEEEEDEESDGSVKPNEYKTKSHNRPHKDLTDSMKKLRKHALEICEITIDSKEISSWNVAAMDISGDYLMKQSRVILTLSHFVKSTGKVISFKTPQITMYPEKSDAVKYHGADKMTTIIEDVIEEVWSYLAGKYEQKGQLPIFPEMSVLKVA